MSAGRAGLGSFSSGSRASVGSHQPAISIIVPVYNVERYIRQAFNSIIAQTFSDFEVVCVNDGSRDSSRKIIQDYIEHDPRFRVIDKPNSGYGATMNRGIQEALGRYIAVLEPDDFYDSHALEKLITAADAVNADVVKGNYWFYWSSPKERNSLVQVVSPSMTGHLFKASEEPEIFFSNPSLWSAIYKRSFLLGNGLKLLETPGASFQDLGFSFKIWATAARIFCISDPVLHYRQDNEKSSVNDPGKVFCVCDEFDSIEDFIKAVPGRKYLKPYAYRLRYDSYMWNFERLSPNLRAEFLDTMVGDLARGMQNGEFVPSLFEPRQIVNLKLIITDPEKFLRLYPEVPTKASKARYYFKIGGFKLLKEESHKE
ncbi:MAG: glycosyltransferase family 2 protein [Coriobacteriales bacterium]|jgi:glycosyltransferase involved in cell wall biosynthesis